MCFFCKPPLLFLTNEALPIGPQVFIESLVVLIWKSEYQLHDSLEEYEKRNEDNNECCVVDTLGEVDPSVLGIHYFFLECFQINFIKEHLSVAQLPVAENNQQDGCSF